MGTQFDALPSFARTALITIWAFLAVNIVAFISDLTSTPQLQRQFGHGGDRKARERARGGSQKRPREVAAMLFRDSDAGRVWSMLQGALALLSASLFVLNTYYDPDPNSDQLSGGEYFVAYRQPVIELAVSFFFLVDYLIQVYLAEARFLYIWQPFSLLDFITFAPTIITWLLLEGSSSLSFVRFLRITRGLTLMKSSVSGSVFRLRREDDTQRQMRILVFTVACLLFISACVIHTVETSLNANGWLDGSGNPVAWHDSLYYLFVTMGTVGYGDIVPQTTLGRGVAIAILVVAFTAVPMQLNKLLELMQKQTAWGKAAALKRNQPHVIVCGQLSFNMVMDFIVEFFHKNRTENAQYKIIFLSSEEPKRDTELLVTSAHYSKRVQYLVGTPLMYDDLLRVKPDRARACFILANKSAPDPDEDDRATFLRCWAFKNARRTLPVFVQLLRSRNERHVRALVDDETDCFFSMERMKMYLLAKSCLAPGFVTLIANLIRSDDLAAHALHPSCWKAEYGEGVNDEIYSVVVDKRWFGLSFAALVADVFCTQGMLVIGMSTPAAREDGEERVDLCRFDARVLPGSRVYVLAPDPATAMELQMEALPKTIALVRKGLVSLQMPTRRNSVHPNALNRTRTGRKPSHLFGRAPPHPSQAASASGTVVPDTMMKHWLNLEQAAARAEQADALERAAARTPEGEEEETQVTPLEVAVPEESPAPSSGSGTSATAGKEEALSPAQPASFAHSPSSKANALRRGVSLASTASSPGGGEARRAAAGAPADDLPEETLTDGEPAPLRPRARLAEAAEAGVGRGSKGGAGFGAALDAFRGQPSSKRGSVDPTRTLTHIILVCGMPEGMHHFIASLREHESGRGRPVVVLDSEPMTEATYFEIADTLTGETVAHGTPLEQLRRICEDQRVFFVQGSPLLLRDLEKAGVDRADVVVVLSEERFRGDPRANPSFDERMVDASSLMTVKLIEDRFPEAGPFIIAGLKFASNGAFLSIAAGPAAHVRRHLERPALSPPSSPPASPAAAPAPPPQPHVSAARAWHTLQKSASGEGPGAPPAFAPERPEPRPEPAPSSRASRQRSTKVSFAVAAKRAARSARALAIGRLARTRATLSRGLASVMRVLGRGPDRLADEEAALVEREDTALLGEERGEKQQYLRPHFAAGRLYWSAMLDSYLHAAFYHRELFGIVRRLVSPREDVQLVQVDIPDRFDGEPYADAFAHFLALRRLPVALYRAPSEPPDGSPPASFNPLPYVVTNPRADSTVRFGDRLFVLERHGIPPMPPAAAATTAATAANP